MRIDLEKLIPVKERPRILRPDECEYCEGGKLNKEHQCQVCGKDALEFFMVIERG